MFELLLLGLRRPKIKLASIIIKYKSILASAAYRFPFFISATAKLAALAVMAI
jgi:hypothetical protein